MTHTAPPTSQQSMAPSTAPGTAPAGEPPAQSLTESSTASRAQEGAAASAESLHPIHRAIHERRTVNSFHEDQPVTDEQIQELVSLATKAPSSFNLQNWRFIAVRTPEAKARLRAVGWDQEKITSAGVTFIVVGQLADWTTTATRLESAVDAGVMPAPIVGAWEAGAKTLYDDQPWRQRDEAVRTATFGAATLIFSAHAMGLGAAPMIGFDPEGVVEQFSLAEDEVPVMLLAVGYATERNWPQKPRRPLPEVLTYA